MTKKLNTIHEKLGKIVLLPNFNVDEPYVTLDVNITPYEFDSGPENQYRVAIGVTKAHVIFEHPAYDVTDRYSAVVEPEVWAAAVSNKSKVEGSAAVKGWFGFTFPGLGGAKAEAKASAERTKQTEINATIAYPIITGTADGWTIGGEHGDPRFSKHTVGKTHSMLQGTYFKEHNDEKSSAEKTNAGKPITAKLLHKPGANDFRLDVTLVVPKENLKIEVVQKNGAALDASLSAPSHADQLKEALAKLCVAKEIEGKGLDGTSFHQKELHFDYIFLARHETRGQKPAAGRTK